MAAEATRRGDHAQGHHVRDDGVRRDHLPFHRLSEAGVLALARGDGDGAVVAELLNAERSRRLLLLRALDDELSRGAPPAQRADPVGYAEAWTLLTRAQHRSPEAFEDVLMSPNTGMWVSLAVRRTRGRSYEEAPRWVVLGHLAALAAAAAARAGLDFSITVPVRGGLVPLPTLGCAVLPDGKAWSTARVAGHEGHLRISGTRGEVEVAPPWDVRVPDWHPRRLLTLGSGEGAKTLVLEDLDPYRTFPRPSEPRPLPEPEAELWRSLLADAWDTVLRDDPESAEAMRRGLMSLTPTASRERFRPHSSTAGDAFGALTASRPDDVAQLAATLVHEFQHTKLGGLMHLEALTVPPPDPSSPEHLLYAPWRDDPRPLGGLLQGIYAFLGVTRFWRAHRRTAAPADAPTAHFEFALWRTQVWSTLNAVRGHEQLTPLGHRVVESLHARCAEWMADEVPAAELRLAQEAAEDHLARWRAHHLRPPAAAVDEAVRAWRRGAARAPSSLAAEPILVPDTEARFLDGAAVLARHRLGEPDGPWRCTAGRHGGDAGAVDGADPADVLLARGDSAGARAAHVERLTRKGAPVSAWAGLGRALADDPAHRAASRLLLRHPERARALQDALEASTGRRADPVHLAAWLASGGTAES
ncbi:HEXXH motif domain-containing protein [Streptomyces sp. NPDC014864]|uniref:HEXXH motif domain-containing protein n=1 Tax=Streptomyces sp. NPDC014864 TaxID=3364924 RepID=UPI0037001402